MNPRTPPRFVPTLTTVLEPALPNAAAEAPPAPVATQATVTEPSQAVALSPEAKLSEAEAFRLEEQLLHRVLQRVDLSLEERVSDAVSAAVQQHLDTMIPGLRREIEAVLRALVSEALARELSDNPGSTPAFGRETLG
jgi:phytoene dehydrogenase-like protein